ncbi:MAG: TIR domain-containing protein, partial [Candidatus Hermodarchaeota archaeon]
MDDLSEAYEGTEPYVFVSYAHKDRDSVYREIKRLQDMGYRIWYDKEIIPTKEWRDEIVDAIEHCKLFLVFLSNHAVQSKYVEKEIYYALGEDKALLVIYLSPTNIPKKLKFEIRHIQDIEKFELSDSQYYQALTKALSSALDQQPREVIEQISVLDLLVDQYQVFMKEELDVARVLPLHRVLPRLLKTKEKTEDQEKRKEEEENEFPFTELLDRHFENQSQKNHAIVIGIPGVGKTSSSLQLTLEQLNRFKTNHSLFLPLWFDLGRNPHQKILNKCLQKNRSSEQIRTYISEMLPNRVKDFLSQIHDDWIPLWILDSWNESPRKFREATDFLNLLGNQAAFLMFSRPGSEPPFTIHIRWGKITRYTLLPLDIEAAVTFLQEVHTIDNKQIAEKIVFWLNNHLGSDSLVPFFLNSLIDVLASTDRLTELKAIDAFFDPKTTTRFAILKKFLLTLIRRECQKKENDTPIDSFIGNDILELIADIFLKLNRTTEKNTWFSEREISELIDNSIRLSKENPILSSTELYPLFLNVVLPKVQKSISEFDVEIQRGLMHELVGDFLLAQTIVTQWGKTKELRAVPGKKYLLWMSNPQFDELWLLVADKWQHSAGELKSFLKSCFQHRADPSDGQDTILDRLLDFLAQKHGRQYLLHHYLFLRLRLATTGIHTLILDNLDLKFAPEWIYQISNLKSLSLVDNQLETLPETFGNLTQLEKLDLKRNKLQTLPETMGQLVNLQKLDLDWDEITYYPRSMRNLKVPLEL